MRVLTLNESLDAKVAKLRELSGLPILVGTGRGHGELLDRFLNIQEADEIVVCIPWMREDRIFGADGKIDTLAEREQLHGREKAIRDMFHAVGLRGGINPHTTVSVEGQIVPDGLDLHVFSQRRRPGDTLTYKALQFYVSNYIANPHRTERRETFFLTTNANEQKYKETVYSTYRQIVAPGQHLPKDRMVAEPWNRYLVADKEPGDCIVCAGSSGERKHFGHMAWGPDPYPTALICRACAKTSFEQILTLLD